MARTMLFTTARCVVCGKPSIVTLEVDKFLRWRAGEHVQDVWPEKTPGEREVLINGTHDECFNKLFPPEAD